MLKAADNYKVSKQILTERSFQKASSVSYDKCTLD